MSETHNTQGSVFKKQDMEDTSITSAESKSINNTRFRRFLVLGSVKLLKLFRPRVSSVLFVSEKICIKYGPFQDLSEASTMRFISRHTSIPVPKVYCSFTHKEHTYVVMERIKGEMLCCGWSTKTAESKEKILGQLRGIVQQMRSLEAPGPGVANVDGGSLYDCRVLGSLNFGPFKSIPEFHKHLRGGIEASPNHMPEISKLIAWHDGPWSLPVFTHGDLSSLNILVCGNVIVGIIDWETSGWYPSYWEYSTASQVNPRNYFWREEIDKFLGSDPKEVTMEQTRLRYFGDI